MLQREQNGDGCDLASTFCKYDLRKGDLFVVSWAIVRRMSRGRSISSGLLMCGGICVIMYICVMLWFSKECS